MPSKKEESFNYWQVDHQIKRSEGSGGVIILPSPRAYDKFSWTRKYFSEKPVEGYFVWVKEPSDIPLSTCVTISSSKISQKLNNLLVVEAGVRADAGVVCNAAKPDLGGVHQARGKMILKEGAQLVYNHVHRWGHGDLVSPSYEFILEKDAHLSYSYKNLLPPKELNLKTFLTLHKKASCDLNITVNGRNSGVNIEDVVRLQGDGSRGVVRLRLVGKVGSNIKALSRMVAEAAGKGHLDCQGLLVDEGARISLIPEVDCQNRSAQVTHEASIGKISDEALNYLRSRGLTEKEAIDLVVVGFLGEGL